MKKEKRHIAPNECSMVRWIAVLVVGYFAATILSFPMAPFAENQVDTFMGIRYAELFGMLTCVPFFWCLVFAIKVVGKTSLKNFVLGAGGKVNKKECLTILGLYVAGFFLSYLPVLGNIRLRSVNIGEFGFLVLFMLLVTWMQTSWEELIFRGLVIRWACKNDVRFTKKALIAAVVSSAAFALMHAGNPEVTSQSGIRIVIGVLNYTIPGLMLYLANLYFGSLLPGMLMHWINNFLLFTLIASEVTAMPVPTLLVDTTPYNAEWVLASELLIYLPIVVYMILDARKRRKIAKIG